MFSPRTTRRTALAGLALVLLSVSACGSDDNDAFADAPPPVASLVVPASTAPPATTEAPSTTQAPTTTEAPTTTTIEVFESGPIDVVAREFEFVGMPDTLRAGTYSVSLTNEGSEAHEMAIFQPTTGKTLEELEAGGPATFANDAKIAGFFPPGGPGAVSKADVTLEPGEYTVACFIPAVVDGMGHFHHGMVKTITVVE